MIESVGWASTLLLGLCGLPQAVKTCRTQSAVDISWLFLLMWLFGEFFAVFYVLFTDIITGVWHTPLLANYILNIIIITYIIYIKILPTVYNNMEVTTSPEEET